MPYIYAHYRFGTSLLSNMPGDVRRTIQRFRQLYEMGLHGPDIFFYNSPLLKTKVGFLGAKYHEQTGESFFERICRNLRLEPSEAATAYLYGVLTHYCLDSVCHPYVCKIAEKGEVSHALLETEFDRHLLELDKKIPACAQDLSQHVRLTPGECETVSRFYPPATGDNIKKSVKNMAFYMKLFAVPMGMRRMILEKGVNVVGKEYGDMLMAEKPVLLCAPHIPELMERYEKAAQRFPAMLSQLQAHLAYGAPFGDEFNGIFG